MVLYYAREGHARRGNVAQTAGLLSEAGCRAAHAILAARGRWVTNEKRLLTLAGLQGVDDLLVGLGSDPGALMVTADAVRTFLGGAVSRSDIDV